jgi:3-mercaptopyruvate sulfurtransferase SseA
MPDPTFPTISLEQLRTRLADPRQRTWLVHATDTLPFHEGHIPGALARPDDVVLERLGRDVPLVIYGEDDAARAAPALVSRMAHLHVEAAWFATGLAGWRAADLPVERSG